MSNEYDYLPLTTGPRKRRNKWLWIPLVFAALFVMEIIVIRSVHPPQGPLDKFQTLNGLSPVNENALAGEAGNISVITPTRDERAVVTTLYSESYVTGVLTLGQSLKAADITARLIVLYIPHRISEHTLCRLQAGGWELEAIERIPPPNAGKGVYHRFLDQYSKLSIWGLDKRGIKNVIYLDGDTIVLRNFDELWSLPFNFAAVPDVYGDARGFTISFNAGMLFLRTSSAVLEDMLLKIGTAEYNHKEAEQGFLNLYYGAQAVRLPYIYNANLAIKPRSPELWQSITRDVRVIHYTLVKPFLEDDEYEPDTHFYDRAMLKSLERKKGMDNGLWSLEMGWWEEHWREMKAQQDGICQ